DVPLLHEAANEGKIAGLNAANYPNVAAKCRGTALSIVFTDPQIAIIGKLPNELKEGSYVTGHFSFEDQGRSRVMLKNKGLMNIYAEYGSGLFLGAEIFGPRAEHLGHLLAWSIENNNTIPEMLEMPFYHPVIEEGLRTALRDTLSKLEMGMPQVMKDMECGPGV
ncbi:MAG: dihydrolipoyl dehydrogenase, partial [Thermodesulfobacteriota bacterium]